jgi:hypothetical protein
MARFSNCPVRAHEGPKFSPGDDEHPERSRLALGAVQLARERFLEEAAVEVQQPAERALAAENPLQVASCEAFERTPPSA